MALVTSVLRQVCRRALVSNNRRIFTSSHVLQHPDEEHEEAAKEFRPENFQSGRFTDIGTRRIFSQEHDMFREQVRRFFQEEVVPYHAAWEEAGEVDRSCWLKAGEWGILGTNTPEEHGGVGGDWLSAYIVHEEQGYVNCSGPGFALHSDIVMPYITNYGTSEQIEKYIPDMTAGMKIGALAMTEPGAGSDLQVSAVYFNAFQ